MIAFFVLPIVAGVLGMACLLAGYSSGNGASEKSDL